MLQTQTRADLFRLLGDEDRLRLFALCAEEELTVSELAELLCDSQPQVSRRAQALRAAGLLSARKDGTRTYLKAVDVADAVVVAALEEGRRLCRKDKSLARIPRVVRDREEGSRRFFDDAATATTAPANAPSLLQFLPLLKPLLGHASEGVCVDVGAGDGALLPLWSPLFERVVAVDRSAARLAACARVVEAADLANVRLLEGDVSDAHVIETLTGKGGGASVVIVARVLHHAARPQDFLAACARLLRPGGVVVVIDYLPHDDEAMRALGDVWLGFEPEKLKALAKEAGLQMLSTATMPAPTGHSDSHLTWQWMAAKLSEPSNAEALSVQ